MLQGAVPDLEHTDPSDGRKKMVELKFISQCPLRHGRAVATSLRAGVNEREQQLYQEYLTRLRLKDRELLHTPDGEVGPLPYWSVDSQAPQIRRTSKNGQLGSSKGKLVVYFKVRDDLISTRGVQLEGAGPVRPS